MNRSYYGSLPKLPKKKDLMYEMGLFLHLLVMLKGILKPVDHSSSIISGWA